MSVLEAAFTLRQGDFMLAARFQAPAGVTGLFGPSGAGKTTVLHCLAGLRRAPMARLRVGEEVWQDEEAGIFRPAHERAVGYVFQGAALFPHLTVRRNLEFGYRRTPVAERRLGWDEVIVWLGLEPMLERRPSGLSGGERQRVAIGRALLASPKLLLMDEPLAALDEVGRSEILPYLERLPARLDLPIVYVSHSLRETARLADHLIWLVNGAVRASGPPATIMGHLDFATWRGEEASVVVQARVRYHDQTFQLTCLEGPWGDIWVRQQQCAVGDPLRVQILSSDVSLGMAPEHDSSILNEFPMVVDALQDVGPGEVLARLRGKAAPEPVLLARVTRRSAERLGLRVDRPVYARVKSVALVE